MVLVDTSVWIRFLTGRPPAVTGLDRLLRLGEVAGHELIHGELLMGDRGGRRALLTDYDALPKLRNVSHAEVVAFVRLYALHGKGIGWIDAHLLASALVAQALFWTADERLATLASAMGVGYRPGR